jgi:hypothetical protein
MSHHHLNSMLLDSFFSKLRIKLRLSAVKENFEEFFICPSLHYHQFSKIKNEIFLIYQSNDKFVIIDERSKVFNANNQDNKINFVDFQPIDDNQLKYTRVSLYFQCR